MAALLRGEPVAPERLNPDELECAQLKRFVTLNVRAIDLVDVEDAAA